MATDTFRDRDWLLLPGTLCTPEVFDGFLDCLGVPVARRKPVALCHPTVEAYGDVLAQSGKDAVICGFSLGAIVAAHHADRLAASLILLFGLNPFPDDPAKAEGRRDLARDVAARGGGAALADRLPPLNGPDPDTTRAKILAMADVAAQDIAAQTELALSRPGALAALARTRSPVVALTGSRDGMAPEDQGRAAMDAAPSGRFRSLPRLGHYALLEDPDTCARCFLELEDKTR